MSWWLSIDYKIFSVALNTIATMDGDSPTSHPNDKDEGAVGIVTDDEFERKLVVVNELLFFVLWNVVVYLPRCIIMSY